MRTICPQKHLSDNALPAWLVPSRPICDQLGRSESSNERGSSLVSPQHAPHWSATVSIHTIINVRTRMTMRKPESYTCPLSRRAVVDQYFLEHRAKLIDIAAFLDRIDRADPTGLRGEDFRVTAIKRAANLLCSDQPDRTKRILELLSDPTEAPVDQATGKGAGGAYMRSIPPATPRTDQDPDTREANG